MPNCCVLNCLHNSRGQVRLFRFPADRERRKKWAMTCGRVNWFPTDYTRICESHFDESQFEQNRQDGKKLLKWNAVPTLFSSSSSSKKNIKRNLWKTKNLEESISPEPKEEMNNVNGTEGPEEAAKRATLRKFNIRGLRSGCNRFRMVSEVALIKAVLQKMGHEVHSEDCHIELNPQEGKKLMMTSVPPPVVTTESTKRTLTVKQYPPKRRRLWEMTLAAADTNMKSTEKVGTSALVMHVPQRDAAGTEDGMAQVKSEAMEMVDEADVEIRQACGRAVLKSAGVSTVGNMASLTKGVVCVKKHVQNAKCAEGAASGGSVFIAYPVPTDAAYSGSCERLTGNGIVISEKNWCLPVEVGIQTDNWKEWEAIPQLRAEVELLKGQLAEKDRKIREVEQRLAAILQPGHVLLLQKFGSNSSGAKKYVILGTRPNRATAEGVR